MSDYNYRVSIRSTQDESEKEHILYEGDDEVKAIQAEIAETTSSIIESSTPIHLIVEAPVQTGLKNSEYIKEVFTEMESKIINSVLNGDITTVRIRLVFHYVPNDDEETIISIENSGDILTSDADTYAVVVMNNDDEYHHYSFYYDDKREVYITQDIREIWNLMKERGYSSKYISFATCSDPIEVRLFTGLE